MKAFFWLNNIMETTEYFVEVKPAVIPVQKLLPIPKMNFLTRKLLPLFHFYKIKKYSKQRVYIIHISVYQKPRAIFGHYIN